MKSRLFSAISFIVTLVIYNYFFWKEGLGLNLFLFAIILAINLFIRYRKSFGNGKVQVVLLGTILTAVMVLLFNSVLSKIVHMLSLVLLAAFIHHSELRSTVYAALQWSSGFISVPLSFIRRTINSAEGRPGFSFAIRIIKLGILPVVIAIVFYILYCNANPIFSEYTLKIREQVMYMLEKLFLAINLPHVLFLIFGALAISAIYFRSEVDFFLRKDMSFSEKLSRIRKPANKVRSHYGLSGSSAGKQFKSMGLKNENRTGVILLLLVNALLLFENLIDIRWLWFGFELPEAFSLKSYVREGTGYLIVSILLSMAVLFYFFKGNQNFYRRNRLLKTLAYLWIAQNLVLCISVFLRNYHYIDFHGLAYKRIGVVVFLLLTTYGLVTTYFKVRDRRSIYYLVRANTWALYFMLVSLSFVNWDVFIAKYNLSHWNKNEIDVDFYLDLSGKALPVVFANLDAVKSQIEAHNRNKVIWIRYIDYDEFLEALRTKRDRFMEDYEKRTWLSFNYADEKAHESFAAKRLAKAE